VLARRGADDAQYVQVELAADETAEESASYWSVRSEIPADVLRDLEPGTIVLSSRSAPEPSRSSFEGGVVARAGFEDLGPELFAEMAGAQLDFEGRLGDLQLQFEGEFRNLAAGGAQPLVSDGLSARSATFRVDLDSGRAGRLGIAGHQLERLVGDASAHDPLDFSNFQLRYVNSFGSSGQTTDVSAQYLDETGLNAGSRYAPRTLPRASRLLAIQGSYAQLLGERGRIRAGVRYRESESHIVPLGNAGEIDQYLDLWSRGEHQVDSTMVLQYGLYTTMRDGSVSLLPRGGVLLRLGPHWQSSVSASQRVIVTDDDPLEGDFTPLQFQGVLACEEAESACYEMRLMHGDGEDANFQLRGSWREFDRTVRLFLREDFFAGSEGIFFVPGDSMPEFQATVRRRISDTMLASWKSSYAEGGGGAYVAANRLPYENRVVYLSASLDTLFEPTSTGVFVAFQRIEQRLEPIRRPGRKLHAPAAAGLDRVELALSQDLTALFDLATSWAVRVGVEVVRGETLLEPATDPDEFRRRLTTSVAVRF
jgi:hypothetical protein